MTITPKNLYSGQLANSLADIIAASAKTLGITNLEFHNTSALTETVVLAFNDGSDWQFLEESLEPDERLALKWKGSGLVLEDTQKLRGSTTTAATVNIIISGHELTPDFGGIAYENVNCIDFGGTDEYIVTHDSSYLDFDYTAPFSISFWVKGSDVASDQVFLSKQETDAAKKGWSIHSLAADSGKVRVALINSATATLQLVVYGDTSVKTSSWVHVVVTFDGTDSTGLHVYTNNSDNTLTVVEDTLATAMTNTAALHIGSYSAGGSPYVGKLAQLTIWDRELTAGEVARLYNSGAPLDPRLHSFIGNGLGWYPLGNMFDKYPIVVNHIEGGAHGLMTNMESGDIVVDAPA